jgi:hypothetical protein
VVAMDFITAAVTEGDNSSQQSERRDFFLKVLEQR